MRRLLLPAVAALLVVAAPASGRTVLVDTAGQPLGGRLQAWVDGALVPTPDAELTIDFASHDPAMTRTYIQGSTIHPIGELDRDALLHEVGHFVDYRLLSDPVRAAIMHSVLGRRGDWRNPPNSPHEQFAEAWRLVARGRRLRATTYTSGYALRASWEQLALLRTWLRNLWLLG